MDGSTEVVSAWRTTDIDGTLGEFLEEGPGGVRRIIRRQAQAYDAIQHGPKANPHGVRPGKK